MTPLLWLAKRPLPLSALEGGDLAFDLALRAWAERRADGLLPARCALDTPAFRLLVPEAEWLPPPASRGEPEELGRLTALAAAEAASPQAARRRLGDLLREDQRTVRFTGSALLQELVIRGPLAVERWRQLLLPTADDGVRVRELVQLCRLCAAVPLAASGEEAGEAALRPRPTSAVAGARSAARPGGGDGRAARPAWHGTPGR